jgi:large subunit ribosomal protein L6
LCKWSGTDKKEAKTSLSRIGKKPVLIPEKVKVKLKKNRIEVEGPRGSCVRDLSQEMKIVVEENEVRVERPSDSAKHRSLHGLTRSLIANMVEGVSNGFEKELEIIGVGYKVEARGRDLNFQLGLSHPVIFEAPEGIEFEIVKPTHLKVKGVEKELVGRIADSIKKLRPPEPYKGKGIRYKGEYIRRKAGKTAM